jgi:basic membrane protein A and related proteins
MNANRRSTLMSAALACLLAVALVGCGGSDKESAAQDNGKASAPAGDSGKQLKVAILLPGSVADKGYNTAAQRAGDLIRDQVGAKVTLAQSVSVPNQADVYRQFAAQGYDLVIGWGGQFTDGAVSVSQEFPDVKFLLLAGVEGNGKNLASLDTDIEDWEFLGGFVTAKLSKSGKIGFVGGQCFPSTAATLHGVEQGARYANPNIKILSTFTGDFEDPTKAQQAAQARIDDGADAMTANLNNGWFGLIKAAQNNGKIPLVTEWFDNRELAPDVIASSIQKSQAKFVVKVAQSVKDGTFKAKHYQYSLPADWGPVMAKNPLLPDKIYQEALDVQKKIVSGEIKPKHETSCPNQ